MAFGAFFYQEDSPNSDNKYSSPQYFKAVTKLALQEQRILLSSELSDGENS